MSASSPEQYRAAERALWAYYGVEPKEQFVELERPRVKLRVLEVGTGEPVLFVHGGPNAGSTWAPLVARLQDFRCLVLDRPGCGLSAPVDYSGADIKSLAVNVLALVADGLGLEQCCIVASSIGGAWTFWLALARPGLVRRIVQEGCPGLVRRMKIPVFLRFFSIPRLNRLATSLPASRSSVRVTLRQMGHSESLAAGRIPDPLLHWSQALLNDTKTMSHELDLIEKVLSLRGVRPELQIADAELSRVSRPTLLLWGQDDPFGSIGLGRQIASALPHAQLRPFSVSGHLPWLDSPEAHADRIREFLRESSGAGPAARPSQDA